MTKKKKRILQDSLIVILAMILIICIGLLGYRYYQYHQGDSIYSEAEQLVKLPDFSNIDMTSELMDVVGNSSDGNRTLTGTGSAEDNGTPVGTDFSRINDSLGNSSSGNVTGSLAGDSTQHFSQSALTPYVDALRNMDFKALREVNPDVIGWIVVPGTGISYPMVQAGDNDYYLHRTWNLTNSIVGSIFMDANCNPDLGDFNTLIYGHNMANGSMFGELRQFKTTAYRNYHPVFLITTDTGVYTYRIFSAFEASVTDPVFMIQVGRNDEKQSLIDCAVEKSVIATGIIPSIEDHIVTLSTCTGHGYATRWVVVGRLESFLESADVNG